MHKKGLIIAICTVFVLSFTLAVLAAPSNSNSNNDSVGTASQPDFEGTVTLTPSEDQLIGVGDTVQLEVTWTTNRGVTYSEWYVDDGGKGEDQLTAEGTSGTSQFNFSSLEPGEYTITFRVWHHNHEDRDVYESITVTVVPYYELTVDKVGEGTVEVNGTEVSLPFEENYLEGTSLGITAVPSEGWVFVEWKVNNETVSDDDGAINITMNNNKGAVAYFEEDNDNDNDNDDEEENNDAEDEDSDSCPAAPAIAAEILKYNNVKPNYDRGKNYISDVARNMTQGAMFEGEEKSSNGQPNPAYYDAVLTYLITLPGLEELNDPR